jgi:predicted peptidase
MNFSPLAWPIFPARRARLLVLLLAVAGLVLPRAAVATEPQVLSSRRAVTRVIGYDYLLSLPIGYDAAGAKRWPLLLFLHGSGESGTDVHRVAVNGPPKLLRTDLPLTADESAAARKLAGNFIVVSPQCPDEGVAWEDEPLLDLIDQVLARYHADPDRVYLTGLSMGGYGVWSLALHHADRFAAVAPISGGGNLLDALNVEDGTVPHAAALRRLGFWVFHGAKDDVVPVSEATRMVDLLAKGGVKDLKLTINPDRGHDVWNVVYADLHFYDWLLAHRRSAP